MPARASIHGVQSSHHDLATSLACRRHASGSSGSVSADPTQCLDLGFGGFTTPAICPELESMNRTVPPISLAPAYTAFHNAMWSRSAEMK